MAGALLKSVSWEILSAEPDEQAARTSWFQHGPRYPFAVEAEVDRALAAEGLGLVKRTRSSRGMLREFSAAFEELDKNPAYGRGVVFAHGASTSPRAWTWPRWRLRSRRATSRWAAKASTP